MTRVWSAAAAFAVCAAATSGMGLAQGEEQAVPVDKAPYHLPVFSNEHVIVMKIDIPPQRDTGYHTHTRDSVSINMEPADLVTQEAGQTQRVPAPRRERGGVTFTPYGSQPRTHRNWNVGTTPFWNVSVIFRATVPIGLNPSSRAEAPAYVHVIDNDRVRGWRLTLDSGMSAAAITQQTPGLRIIVAGGEVVERVPGQPDRPMSVKTGEFYWQDPGQTRAMHNAGSSRVELLEFELK